MTNKNHVGPAFPVSALVYNEENKDPSTIIHDGMSLRDYFAAKAMLGVAHEALEIDEIAVWAYKMADAMLKAREE